MPFEGAWGRRALAVLESALDAVVCIDAHGRILSCNPAAGTLLGCDGPAAVGRPAQELLGPGGLWADLERVLAEDDPAPRRVERQIAAPGGRSLWVEASITTAVLDGERIVALFVRDVSLAKRAERRRDVEHRLARVLAAARSGEEIAQSTLELLATGLEFDHAELWMADRTAATLRLTSAWRRVQGSPFGRDARRLVLGREEDLAGLAAGTGETVCLDDAQSVDGLVRAEALAAEGIRACAALPIAVGRAVAAVVVLARTGPEPVDPGLRQTLHSVAVQLGHFAERRGAERRLAEETVALAAVARATRRLTDAVDSATAGRAICSAALEVCGAAEAYLALPDPEHGGLVVHASAPGELRGMRFAAEAGSASLRAFESGQAAFVSDLEISPGGALERARDSGVVSGLAQPIVRDDLSLGVIGVGWTTRQATLDASTRLLMRLLAAEAASALSRVQLVSRLEAAARTDPLTELANVRSWQEQVARELASAARVGRPVAVALLDLDGFKTLNDRLGHQAGDRVLRACASAWRDQLRQGDLLARLGGDEFGVLLPGCEPDDAVMLAERLREATEETTASVGVACWEPGESAAELMLRADAALYEAKAAGRDRVATS